MNMPRFAGLQTARLALRRFRETDLLSFLAYRNDPEIARYQSWEGCTEAEARAFIAEMQTAEPGVRGAWFQFAMELKSTGVLVGDCALKIDGQEPRQGEIGYSLARAYQGQGLAAEGVSCLLDYAFGPLNLHRIIAVSDCENAASVALLERLGLRREGHFIQNVWFKGRWGDEYLYAVLRDEWLARRPR